MHCKKTKRTTNRKVKPMSIDDFEHEHAMDDLKRGLLGGYSKLPDDSVENHPLTGNWSHGPLLTKPHKHKPLPKLPPIKFGKQR